MGKECNVSHSCSKSLLTANGEGKCTKVPGTRARTWCFPPVNSMSQSSGDRIRLLIYGCPPFPDWKDACLEYEKASIWALHRQFNALSVTMNTNSPGWEKVRQNTVLSRVFTWTNWPRDTSNNWYLIVKNKLSKVHPAALNLFRQSKFFQAGWTSAGYGSCSTHTDSNRVYILYWEARSIVSGAG